MNSVAKQITTYANENDLTVCEFAKMAGIDFGHVYRYIRGESLPSLINAKKICRTVGCSMDELTEDIE